MAGTVPSSLEVWRSLDEIGAGDVEAVLEAEFPSLHAMGGVSRRDLMRLMGASLALASLAACGEPRGRPRYSQARDPEGATGERAIHFATSLDLDGYGRGVLVKSVNGRPVKIEGNPAHVASLGASDPFMQAEILSLYDADRSRRPFGDGAARDWRALRRWLLLQRAELGRSGGAGTHVLLGPSSSTTLAAVIARVRAAFPAIRFHSYSPVSDPFDPAPLEVVDFAAADAVLSLGADFLGAGPMQLRNARHWSRRRREAGARRPMLFVAEATPTLTGAQADRRFPVAPGDMDAFTRAVLAALDGGATGDAADVARGLGRGGVVLAGDDPGARAIADSLNARIGSAALRQAPRVRLAAAEGLEPLGPLVAELAAGRVRRLLILDCNPAYDVPGFGALAARVPDSLHLGMHRDETARICRWHVPQRHALEAWGNDRAFDGSASIRQPAVLPLVSALSPIELLAMIAGERADGQALVREQWSALSDAQWGEVLQAGVVPNSPPAAPPAPPPPVTVRTDPSGGIELIFQPDARLWDGRFANNAWLQELPHPLTKLVWGNAALISPSLADRLGLENGDMVAIARGGVSLDAPVWVMPGQAAGAVTLTLGYGRPFAGRVGAELGYNAYPLCAASGPVQLRKLGRKGRLISTQQHQPLGPGSPVRVTGREDEEAADQPSFYPEYAGSEHAWGMVIDLEACIGCGACTIACQAENNIPVVGPDEVERGREMHWIRVDRYYSGAPDNPDTLFQPVPCMHCEQAPCEPVCPVGATSHSSEGLNQMVYNRCIGTRTCSNNCPYKVRRFNWFDNSQAATAAAPNPRVTVRGRGVMEKCTYCVQRINDARSDARAEQRPIRDGDLQTACQQACPSNAIVFGDLADPNSEVSRLKRSGRNYLLLGDLNTRPRTSYLAAVRKGSGG